MRIILLVFCLLISIIEVFGYKALVENPLHAIQIVRSENHSFIFESDELKKILESNEIKDRYVVVVSIIDKQNSLVNFFIRYLNAEVTRK